MIQEQIDQTKQKMQKSLEHFTEELKTIHTGRATPSLVEKIEVSYYETSTPIIQLAAITVPDPKTIVIQPWDKNVIADIEKALRTSDLGFGLSNDGNLIRINLPQLTEEVRQKLVKVVHDNAEGAKISMRNIRHEIWNTIQDLEKEKKISEDEKYSAKEQLDKMIEDFEKQVEEIMKNKEREITEI